jgi:fructose/tagatose bisphosphate aldolase
MTGSRKVLCEAQRQQCAVAAFNVACMEEFNSIAALPITAFTVESKRLPWLTE